MTANTPIFSFPYPLGTDRVMDGDDAIHNLALAVENVKGIKTVLTPQNGVAAQDADGIAVFRLPGQGLLRLFVNNAAAVGAGVIVCTLPVGVRPIVRSFGAATTLSPSPGTIALDMGTDGNVKLQFGIGAGGIWGGVLPFPL